MCYVRKTRYALQTVRSIKCVAHYKLVRSVKCVVRVKHVTHVKSVRRVKCGHITGFAYKHALLYNELVK